MERWTFKVREWEEGERLKVCSSRVGVRLGREGC